MGEIADGKKFSETRKNKQGKTTINWQEKLKTAELRVPSLKGVLRWWFRAIFGGDNLELLKRSEDEIFGSTDVASKIKIRIENPKIEIKEWRNTCWANYQCSKVEGKNYPLNGYQYLAYINYVKTTREGKIDIRKFITHGSTFDLIMTSVDKQAFENALISFWFALHFGGFGNRARRGFGKLQSNQVDILPKPFHDDVLKHFDFCPAKDLNSHKELVDQGLMGWKQYRQRKGISSISSTKYTNMVNARLFFIENKTPVTCNETLDKIPYTTWELALNEAGKRFQYFRQEYQPDKSAVLNNNNK
jgi:CRISPR-associated RAMP protein, Cmr1 family